MPHPVRNSIIFLLLLLALYACKKQTFSTNGELRLQTTADTLHFDTVFTSTGSVSQVVKIINNNNEGIRVSSVQLAGGASSAFKINVDGVPGPAVNNVEVPANDSIYVFVTVSINPTTINLPFLVRDSLSINYNGNRHWVQLEAWGRNARFLRGRSITANEVWTNDLPYVILDGITVEENATLTIQKGTQLYFNAFSPLLVKGTLRVDGDTAAGERVVFRSDRLDEPYRDYPAGFPGLIFTETSKNNVINYAIIKNAYQGIIVSGPSSGTKLTISQTIIDNAYDAGLLGLNTSISADNLLVSNCGKNIMLLHGGNYRFNHCTSVAYSNRFIPHKEPVLLISNFLSANGSTTTNSLTAVFNNSIFWGESGGLVNSEVAVVRQGTTPFSLQFDNVLWRVPNDPQHATITGNNIKNQNPQFDSLNTSQKFYNFRLKSSSPAINKGSNTPLTVDLDGRLRAVALPDLGAYERQ